VAPTLHTRAKRNHGSIRRATAFSLSGEMVSSWRGDLGDGKMVELKEGWGREVELRTSEEALVIGKATSYTYGACC